MSTGSKKKMDIASLTSSIKKTMKHTEDDVARDVVTERDKALQAFQEQFLGVKKEPEPKPKPKAKPKEPQRKKLSRPEKKEKVSNAKVDLNGKLFTLMARQDLTSTEKLMIIFIKNVDCNGDGLKISVRDLAKAMGINKNTALDTMISLEMKAILEKKSTPRGTYLKVLDTL